MDKGYKKESTKEIQVEKCLVSRFFKNAILLSVPKYYLKFLTTTVDMGADMRMCELIHSPSVDLMEYLLTQKFQFLEFMLGN